MTNASTTYDAQRENAVRPGAVASAFVTARRAARALPAYPGEIPSTLAESYVIQNTAIGYWGDAIAGWKVGRIAKAQQAELGADRLAGPIFADGVWRWTGASIRLPVITGGFAAAEAEIALEIGCDVPGVQRAWTLADADAVVSSARAAMEFAGSPLATINELGPRVVVSDFGNNTGMILGPNIPDWRNEAPRLECVTQINGRVVGRAIVGPLETGPLESVRFLLENLGARGIALPRGAWVCTGAITGVHDVKPPERANCIFGDLCELVGIAVPAAERVRA